MPLGTSWRSADAARPYRFRRRHPGGEHQAERGCRLGAAKRPRHSPMPTRFRSGSRLVEGRMVGGRTITGRRSFRSRSVLPTASASNSATPSSSMSLAATSPPRIANMRTVDWESLGINFVMVFSPNAFRGAPHHLATLTYPRGGTPRKRRPSIRPCRSELPDGHRRARKGRAGSGRQHCPTLCWPFAAPAPSRLSPPRWCLAGRSRPATATGSTMR